MQAGSMTANDRSNRSAKSSAFYRQRRKEKELETLATIAWLEQRVRDLTTERDRYRQERDHFLQQAYAAAYGLRPLSSVAQPSSLRAPTLSALAAAA
jgi:hypothetical protein